MVRRQLRRAATRLLLTVTTATGACGDDDGTGAGSGSNAAGTRPPVATADVPTAPTIGDAAASTAPSPGRESTLPVIVDTDLAGDDIVALAYLTADPRVDLRAVSVSGTGEVTCPRGAEVATAVLAALGRPDVPVACGTSEPLSGDRTFPPTWRAAADDAWDLSLPAVAAPAAGAGAAALLTDQVTSARGAVTLLTLGPLTNVAEALAARPDLITGIARVVVMGGAVDVPGNVELDGAAEPLKAEWNFFVDPQAAAAVLASGASVTLVTLDATNQVPVTEDTVAVLATNDSTEATAVVRQLFDRYPPSYLWDPLAAIAVTDPDLVQSDEVTLGVVTEGVDAGRTIHRADGASVEMLSEPADPEALVAHLLRTLSGTGDGEQLVTPTTVPAIAELALSFDGATCLYDGPETLGQGTYRIELRPGPTPYWGVVAHLVPGATIEEAVAWIGAHPDEPPPMVDAIVVVGDGALPSPGAVEFRPDTVGVACLAEDDSIHVAASVAVRP